MTLTATVHVGKLSLGVDMTDANQEFVPLATIVEAYFPGVMRWQGIVGRTQLQKLELDALSRPWKDNLIPLTRWVDTVFDDAWAKSAPGHAVASVARKFQGTAVLVFTENRESVAASLSVESAETWKASRRKLEELLDEYGEQLEPKLRAPLYVFKPPHSKVVTGAIDPIAA